MNSCKSLVYACVLHVHLRTAERIAQAFRLTAMTKTHRALPTFPGAGAAAPAVVVAAAAADTAPAAAAAAPAAADPAAPAAATPAFITHDAAHAEHNVISHKQTYYNPM